MNAHVKIQQIRRAKLEAYVEQLIALLDSLDGDENLEDGGDMEPSLGSSPQLVGKSIEYDLEFDNADDEFTGDEHEPTLGWANPKVGESDHEAQWTPSDVSDEKLHPSDADLNFNGDGHHIGRKLLRDKVKDRRRLAEALDRTRVAPSYGQFI
jgi:hypothetical protein